MLDVGRYCRRCSVVCLLCVCVEPCKDGWTDRDAICVKDSRASQELHRVPKRPPLFYDTIRYDTRYYFNVRSKADISQLNLPHGTDN